jgi:hypothetical protein
LNFNGLHGVISQKIELFNLNVFVGFQVFTAVAVRSNTSHDNENVLNIGQGEARQRKYKRLKLGGGQAYDRSND